MRHNSVTTSREVSPQVLRENFVGREKELAQITQMVMSGPNHRALLLQAAPCSGASELLRQTHAHFFHLQCGVVPLYFNWSLRDETLATALNRLLHTLLSQISAYRRQDLSVLDGFRSINDLAEQAGPQDFAWMTSIARRYREGQEAKEEMGLGLFLDALGKAQEHDLTPLVLFDDIHQCELLTGGKQFGAELFRRLSGTKTPTIYTGLRRILGKTIAQPENSDANLSRINFDRLSEADAREMITRQAEHLSFKLTDEARDLIALELAGLPALISPFIQAAARELSSLETFLNCQKIYIDQIFAGNFHQRFSKILLNAAPQLTARRTLLRLLHESAESYHNPRTSIEEWSRRIGTEPADTQQIVSELHTHEVVNYDQNLIDIKPNLPWRDFIKTNFRLQVEGSPRARVLTEALMEVLKRAPQMMGRLYRRSQSLDLISILSQFNCQILPRSIFFADQFQKSYQETTAQEIEQGLRSEKETLKLPQIISAQAAARFQSSPSSPELEDQFVIAHGFESGSHTEVSEVVWLVAQIQTKHATTLKEAEDVHHQLQSLARGNRYERTRFWVVSSENFTPEASAYFRLHQIYNSLHTQLQILDRFLQTEQFTERNGARPDEYELTIPMGSDTELVAATAVEQIARRMKFSPEEINQIKTALIEACINAAEHSHSPDRKIHHRFRLEEERLVMIISSRGIVPKLAANGDHNGSTAANGNQQRRGWGLKLMKQLMDEVEFERVDDGTRLRMVKYRQPPQTTLEKP